MVAIFPEQMRRTDTREHIVNLAARTVAYISTLNGDFETIRPLALALFRKDPESPTDTANRVKDTFYMIEKSYEWSKNDS